MFFFGFQCDICGKEIAWQSSGGFTSKERAKKWAREKGWSFGKQDKCPDCAKKKGNDA